MTSRRALLQSGLGILGGTLGSTLIPRNTFAQPERASLDPTAAHIGRELARIHRSAHRDGVRGEHLRALAANLRLLSASGLATDIERRVAATKGTPGEVDEAAIRAHLEKLHGLDLSQDRPLPVLSSRDRQSATNALLLAGTFDKTLLRMADDLEGLGRIAALHGGTHVHGIQDPNCAPGGVYVTEMNMIQMAAIFMLMDPFTFELGVILYAAYWTCWWCYQLLCGY